MISKQRTIGGIEIGTAKVSVLIGEVVDGKRLNLIGFGTAPSRGVLKGTIYDRRLANDDLHEAVRAAEKMAQTQIDEVYLAFTGDHLDGFYNEARVTVSSSDGEVTEEDLWRVESNAKAKQLENDRVVVQSLRGPYRLDGRQVPNPVEMTGNELEVGVWKVHGERSRVSDSIRLLNGNALTVEELILSSIASGEMVTQDEERQSGVLVLDIGSGTTDYAVFKHNHILQAGAIPLGGDHLTNDLSLALNLSRKEAEQIKVHHGKALAQPEDRKQSVYLEGTGAAIGQRSFSQYGIGQIIEARVQEIFEIVQEKVSKEVLNDKYLPSGVVITGGTSKLPGLDQAGSKVLGLPVRCGTNPTWVVPQLQGPECSTMLGLLYRGLRRDKEKAGPVGVRSAGTWTRIKQVLGLGGRSYG